VRARRLVTALVALATAVACGSSTDNGPQPAHVIVAPDAVTIPQQGTATLSVSVTDQNDQLITGAVVTFSSSNTQILTVSNLGVITSVGPSGTANVIAKSGRASTSVPVNVTQVSSGISVSPNPATLNQKTTLQLQAQVVDAVGTPIPGSTINYSPANPSLISVSPTGLITSLGPGGTTSLMLSTPTLNRTISVVVNQVASDLRVAPSSVRIGKTGKAQLVATIVDAVGAAMPSGSITWTSNDQSIATVSSTGVVTAVGPLGSTTITVKSGNFTRTVAVEVANISRPSGTSVTTASFANTWGLGISSNGAIVAPGYDGAHSAIVDPAGAVLPTNGSAGGLDVTFNSTGTTAYIGNQVNNRIDVVDVASNTVVGNFTVVQPIAVQMSRDDQTLYVGAGGLVVAYDPATHAEKTRITVPGTINAMTLHPSQNLLYVTGFEAGAVTEINTSTNTVTRTFHVGGTAQEAVVTADGSTLYVAIEGSDLAMFDLASGVQGPSISGAGGFGAALTPDGLELWVVSGGTLKMVDLGARTFRSLALPTGGRRIVFSNDASVAVITQEGSGFMFVR
jgi:hypothetical protein